MLFHSEELLILTKTYPVPSTKYRETTCVAAINRQGQLRRLYPIPFRFLDGEQQFQRWEWIRADVMPAPNDRRPESHKVRFDTIERLHEKIGTEQKWRTRLAWLEPCQADFEEMEKRRQETEQTLGCIRPTRLIGLEITPDGADWTQSEKNKLAQAGLFDDNTPSSNRLLRKIPFQFHYRYECSTSDGAKEYRHLITDWEAGALYWNCIHDHGPRWETAFRKKLETEFSQKDLIFLMGTVHRFPNQWLIIGLIYPPKPKLADATQLTMGLEP